MMTNLKLISTLNNAFNLEKIGSIILFWDIKFYVNIKHSCLLVLQLQLSASKLRVDSKECSDTVGFGPHSRVEDIVNFMVCHNLNGANIN